MRSPFVAGQRMNFIDDHCFHAAEHFAAFNTREQQVQRFRSGDQQMRRPAEHRRPIAVGGVAGADDGANWLRLVTGIESRLSQFRERHFQIAVDIVRKRPQRGNVNHTNAIGEPAFQRLAQQSIEAKKKCG